jgi:hypothetical protein
MGGWEFFGLMMVLGLEWRDWVDEVCLAVRGWQGRHIASKVLRNSRDLQLLDSGYSVWVTRSVAKSVQV